MDDIDKCKEENRIGDLSVMAYQLLGRLANLEFEIGQITKGKN